MINYRPEIDGLRALAVVPVILFHAGFELFSGGFIGVDVFFVISGYLITTILIEDIESDRFSLLNFYERRARRILPALFFVMFVCIIFAWMLMLPGPMKDFSQSLIAISLFASNILFWQKSGYFDATAEEIPLIHTWSIAVEEQYYLLFPVFLILAWRFGKNSVFWMIVAMSAISLLLSEWGWRNKSTASYYLAPTRAWELFAGSIAVFIVQRKGVQKNNVLAMLGLAAIVFSIFFYDERTPWPSVYGLVPVLGVVLLLLYADRESLAAKLLSTRVFVFIGLISYSAYLWHQPLFAFVRIRQLEPPPPILMLVLSFTSIILAYLSWKYIEKPFRAKSGFQRKKVLIASLMGLVVFAFLGMVGHSRDGFPGRYSIAEQSIIESIISTAAANPLRLECHFPDTVEALERKACTYFSDSASIAVVGNSHATELAYAFAKELESSKEGVLEHTISGCVHNYLKADDAQGICYKWHKKTIDALVQNASIETVVLSYRNEEFLANEAYLNSLVKISETLILANKKVILVLQAPLPGAHINKYVSVALIKNESDIKGMSVSKWDEIYQDSYTLLKKLPNSIVVVNPKDLFCDKISCSVIKNNKALYFDDDHLSIEGASIIAQYILKTHLNK
jgi:peptidoglycan/LPS O-acetylase OafA/YrhL